MRGLNIALRNSSLKEDVTHKHDIKKLHKEILLANFYLKCSKDIENELSKEIEWWINHEKTLEGNKANLKPIKDWKLYRKVEDILLEVSKANGTVLTN